MSQKLKSKRLYGENSTEKNKQNEITIVKRESNARVESQIESFEMQLRQTRSIVLATKTRLKEIDSKLINNEF
jgi:hypothetical protein